MINLTRAILVVLLSCFGLLAQAETRYTIVHGDTLSHIAHEHHVHTLELAKSNNISNPDKIFVGQVITINDQLAQTESAPKVEHRTVTHANDRKEFQWRKPGSNKCTLCDRDGFIAANYPEDVAAEFADKFATTITVDTIEIKAGDRFDTMMFGHKQTRHNVVAAWKDGHTEPARQYAVEKNGKRYLLILPNICGNWAKQVVDPPPMATPEVPTAPIPPPLCKTCPALKASYVFPAVPEGTPIEDTAVKKFYDTAVQTTSVNQQEASK